MKVRLLDATVLDVDPLSVMAESASLPSPAPVLCAASVQHRADIADYSHFVDRDLLVAIHADADDFRKMSTVGEMECKTQRFADPPGFAPSRPSTGIFQNRNGTRRVQHVGGMLRAGGRRTAEQFEQESQVITLCRSGELVQETLDGECDGVRARRTPPSERSADRHHRLRTRL